VNRALPSLEEWIEAIARRKLIGKACTVQSRGNLKSLAFRVAVFLPTQNQLNAKSIQNGARRAEGCNHG
jgi:hypothetical protein